MRTIKLSSWVFIALAVVIPTTARALVPLAICPSDTIVYAGHRFTVAVDIGSVSEPVQDLLGIGFQVHFDPAPFSVSAATAGDFLEDGSVIRFSRLDNDQGLAAYSVTQTAAPGVSGAGRIVVFEFDVDPMAVLGRYTLLMDDVQAVDSIGNPIVLELIYPSIIVGVGVGVEDQSWTAVKRLFQ